MPLLRGAVIVEGSVHALPEFPDVYCLRFCIQNRVNLEGLRVREYPLHSTLWGKIEALVRLAKDEVNEPIDMGRDLLGRLQVLEVQLIAVIGSEFHNICEGNIDFGWGCVRHTHHNQPEQSFGVPEGKAPC